jgi:hypothetical protein
MSLASLREVHPRSLGRVDVQQGRDPLTHLPKNFVPAVPLVREGQESLVRFLAGRISRPGGPSDWNGAFAAVAALQTQSGSKE